MEDGSIQHTNPRTVEDIFKDYKARHAGLLKALTSEVEAFYQSCDPDKDNLCLYGYPNGKWEVNLPAEEIPPELPEPALGINFARDGMQRQDWLSLVAVHSDAWILSVAYYFGARLDKTERKQLFNLINDLPTLFDIVTGRRALKEKSSANNSSKNKGKPDPLSQGLPIAKETDNDSEDDEDDDEHSEATCGSCGKKYTADEFWICCDSCERWFHGKCVKVTPARAEHLKQYKCPSCSKRART
ncbi:hypothetical protein GOP47_0018523 [Adiantum capillus-veneris]|uniref:PHD-type domain-containing protein n=1 Tax=Adiantum capillus-veneris TaxID=13818 RepID=A0A9D4UDB9_ADICA|nr:hypothetical protein GOP47_0018523 [Adiantum capillus-veneris]